MPDGQSQPASEGLARIASVQAGQARSGLLAPQLTLVAISDQLGRTQVSVLHVVLAARKLPRST